MIPTIENPMHDYYYVFRHFAMNACNHHYPIHLPGSIRLVIGLHTVVERPLMQALKATWPSFPGSAVDCGSARS